jgi:hypothetical protein
MLRKCANPECSVPFRYLHEGKLFVLEIAGQRRKLDCHWLCDSCCRTLTVTSGSGQGITLVRALQQGAQAVPEDAA